MQHDDVAGLLAGMFLQVCLALNNMNFVCIFFFFAQNWLAIFLGYGFGNKYDSSFGKENNFPKLVQFLSKITNKKNN